MRPRARSCWSPLLLAFAFAVGGYLVGREHGKGDGGGTTTAQTSTGGGAAVTGDAEAGAEVFASAGCGGCHALSAAGSTGNVGPSLDGTNRSEALVIDGSRTARVRCRRSATQLSEQQIADVAAYVARVHRRSSAADHGRVRRRSGLAPCSTAPGRSATSCTSTTPGTLRANVGSSSASAAEATSPASVTTPFVTVTSTVAGSSHITLRMTSSSISCRISSSGRANARTRSPRLTSPTRSRRGRRREAG